LGKGLLTNRTNRFLNRPILGLNHFVQERFHALFILDAILESEGLDQVTL